VKGPAPAKDDLVDREIAVEVWKKVVQTQEHFNEICMKVRTLYATVLAVILSVYGAFLKQGASALDLRYMTFSPILPISLSIILVTGLFYFVDRYWYHRLLLGAVDQGAEIEQRWANIIPEMGMGAKISERSAIDINHRPLVAWFARLFVSDKRLKENGTLHSDAKIEIFYKPVGWFALIVFVLAIFFGGLQINGRSIASYTAQFVTEVTHFALNAGAKQ
jgi:hypothetical protein